MKNPIEDILKELGWTSDTFKIPVANEENKRLEEQIEQKARLKEKLKTELECHEKIIQSEREKINRYEKEYEQNKKLVVACSTRAEVEKNLYDVTQNTHLKTMKEIREFEINKKDFKNKSNCLREENGRIENKISLMKRKIKQKHNYLLQSEHEIDKKEKRIQLIEEIGMMDIKSFRESERERKKCKEEVDMLRHLVTKTANEISELEIVFKNTTKLHSEVLTEHFDLIRQWTQSTTVLQSRDRDIEDKIIEMKNLDEKLKQRKLEIEEADNFVTHINLENKMFDFNTKNLETQLIKLKDEFQNYSQINHSQNTQIIVHKKGFRNLQRNLDNTRSASKQKMLDLETKQAKLDEYNNKIKELKIKLGEIVHRKSDVVFKTQQLEDTVENEIKRKEISMKRLKQIQNQILMTSNQVNEMGDELRNVHSEENFEIRKCETLNILQIKCEKLLCEKKEEENNCGLELLKHDKKLQKIMGNDDDSNQIEKKKFKLEELNKIYNDKISESKILHTQITNLKNDLRLLKNCLLEAAEKLNYFQTKKHELVLIMNRSEKEIRVLQTNIEEKQVEENILRLKVMKVEKLVSKINDNVYDLEKYKLEIEALMQERKTEILAQKEFLNLERRLHSEEITELNNIISEIRSKIKQLQTRYYNYVSTFDQDGEKPLDTTYLKIQIAQEKFFLQEQGDNLDNAIRKCEYEIESMENTLKIVNICNNKFKSNMALVDDESTEKAERNALNEEMCNVMDKIKKHKKRLQEVQQNVQKIQVDYENLLKDLETVIEKKTDKFVTIDTLKKQIDDQQNKILRANKNVNRLLEILNNMCMRNVNDVLELQEKDVTLKELTESNLLTLHRLIEFMIRNIQAEGYVKNLLSLKNIDLPSAPEVKLSAGSRRSSVSISESQNKNINNSKAPCSQRSINSVITIQSPW